GVALCSNEHDERYSKYNWQQIHRESWRSF
ncbi:unnamed protein product, partial [Oikopleura dioica]